MRLFILFVLCFYQLLTPSHLVSKSLNKQKLLKDVQDYCKQRENNIIQRYLEFLSIPNVSTDRENIRKNANYIKGYLDQHQISSKIIETKGNPVVYGELLVPSATSTLLFYAHYDGQPVDPSKWTDHLPFSPVIRKGKLDPLTQTPKPVYKLNNRERILDGWRIYARGASDDKAPVLCLMNAIAALTNHGYQIPHNIKFIFEGEEEIGSPNIKSFLIKHKDLLKADVLFMCDGPGYFSNDPTLFFGVRGIVSFELTTYGPLNSLHSGHYGNWAPNPALRLAQLLATMKDKDGRIIINRFYDTVTPLSPTEKEAISLIPGYEEHLKALYQISSTENPNKTLIECLHEPSLNINGLSSGWIGKNSRTIVPSQATASIDVRLVKGNEGNDMVERVVKHIQTQGYHIIYQTPTAEYRKKYPHLIRVDKKEMGYKAFRTPMDSPMAKAVLNAFKGYFNKPPIALPTLGGSLPISTFYDILEIPVIGVPIVNYDNNQHQPDENVRIGHLWKGIETFAALLMMEIE